MWAPRRPTAPDPGDTARRRRSSHRRPRGGRPRARHVVVALRDDRRCPAGARRAGRRARHRGRRRHRRHLESTRGEAVDLPGAVPHQHTGTPHRRWGPGDRHRRPLPGGGLPAAVVLRRHDGHRPDRGHGCTLRRRDHPSERHRGRDGRDRVCRASRAPTGSPSRRSRSIPATSTHGRISATTSPCCACHGRSPAAVTIPIDTDPATPTAGTPARISGWGTVRFGDRSPISCSSPTSRSVPIRAHAVPTTAASSGATS